MFSEKLNSHQDDTHVVIAGAGISGLYLALRLKQNNVPFTIIEARQRSGGRICSKNGYDLGPAWFWPGHQRVAALLDELGIGFYRQQDEGYGLYQTEQGMQRLPSGYTGTAYRVEGGWQAVTDTMSDDIGDRQIHFNHTLSAVKRSQSGLNVHVKERRQCLSAHHLALTFPPRLIAQNVTFSPTLPESFNQQLVSTPTWMASHAKALIRYACPFWREAGLSGTVLSSKGPLMQIHDASLPDTAEYALFGFVGLSADERQSASATLQANIIAQLTALFGKQAAQFVSADIVDWSVEPQTAAEADRQPLNYHPVYGGFDSQLWEGQLHFCSTETAPHYGGFIEGALEAADNVLSRIMSTQAKGMSLNAD